MATVIVCRIVAASGRRLIGGTQPAINGSNKAKESPPCCRVFVPPFICKSINGVPSFRQPDFKVFTSNNCSQKMIDTSAYGGCAHSKEIWGTMNGLGEVCSSQESDPVLLPTCKGVFSISDKISNSHHQDMIWQNRVIPIGASCCCC
eukprot:scaffold2065_cov107-Cylindrotheca_fusiformis.AAC.1